MNLALSSDVAEFISLLEAHGVRYLLVGGHAVVFHGYPRLTADVDIAYDPEEGNASRLWAALEAFWGSPVPVVHDAADLMTVGVVFQFGRPPNRIDLLSRLDGVDFPEAWQRRVSVVVAQGPVAVIGLYDLRCTKRAVGRPRDREDLANLPAARKPRIRR